MYKSFEVKNFRCFDHLKVGNLARINLIAGMNGVGKTALLEALFLHCGGRNPGLTLSVNALRGVDSFKIAGGAAWDMPWDSLFPWFDVAKEIELVGEDEASGTRTICLRVVGDAAVSADVVVATDRRQTDLADGEGREVVVQAADAGRTTDLVDYRLSQAPGALLSTQVGPALELEHDGPAGASRHRLSIGPEGVKVDPPPPQPPFPAYFTASVTRRFAPEDAQLFSQLARHGREDVIATALRAVEPRLLRVELQMTGDKPTLWAVLEDKGRLPLFLMGQGVVSLANLLLRIAHAPDGVVLYDEIENGIHYSVLEKVWRGVGTLAREVNCQLFATTHSLECIEAAHAAFSDGESYDFRLHRLQRVGDTIEAITYDQERLDAAEEMELEVR